MIEIALLPDHAERPIHLAVVHAGNGFAESKKWRGVATLPSIEILRWIEQSLARLRPKGALNRPTERPIHLRLCAGNMFRVEEMERSSDALVNSDPELGGSSSPLLDYDRREH